MNLTKKANGKLNLSINLKREFAENELDSVLSDTMNSIEDDLARIGRLFKSEGLEKGRMIHVQGGSFGTRTARPVKVAPTPGEEPR